MPTSRLESRSFVSDLRGGWKGEFFEVPNIVFHQHLEQRVVAADLAKWLDGQNMKHVRGAPYHPMTQSPLAAPLASRITYRMEDGRVVAAAETARNFRKRAWGQKL